MNRTTCPAFTPPRPWHRAARALALMLALTLAGPAQGGSRITDTAHLEGVRDNLPVGYDPVVNHDGTSDSLRNAAFTVQSRVATSSRSSIDVAVSVLGDAKSRRGGTLLVTQLQMVGFGESMSLAQGRSGGLGGRGCEGEMFEGPLREEYARPIRRSGGTGRADGLWHAMLHLWEVT